MSEASQRTRLPQDWQPAAILVLYALSFFATRLSVFPQLVIQTVCDELFADGTDCSSDDVVKEADVWLTYLCTVEAFSSFVLTPAVTTLSDRRGRRAGLHLLTAAGACYQLLICFWIRDLTSLFVMVATLGGLCSMFQMLIMVYAMVADKQDAGERAEAFGRLECGVWIGVMLGPLVGSATSSASLGGLDDTRAPFLASGLLMLLALVCTFLVRETHGQMEITPLKWQRLTPLSLGYLLKSRRFFFLSLALTLSTAAQVGNTTPINLYTKRVFNWGSSTVGDLASVAGVGAVLANGVLLRVLQQRRVSELNQIISACCLNFVGCCILIGSPNRAWMVFVGDFLAAFGGIVFPIYRAIMSRATCAAEQGMLFGCLEMTEIIGYILAPLTFGPLFFFFESLNVPSLTFILPPVLNGAAVLIASSLLRCDKAMPIISPVHDSAGNGDDQLEDVRVPLLVDVEKPLCDHNEVSQRMMMGAKQSMVSQSVASVQPLK
ncbi:hypothetical protein CYMTET_54013 [Cymbomonas tetramitiformis]|uniref:Uncharacterized protein n=1 Tax=Cymbomonas tetramitiformis TaxID=36881 RepID=A0AAE0BHL9_9CHLO|nr:hypothetical protein CYMTET_54013 [Cymbomonas tetramitiformis]